MSAQSRQLGDHVQPSRARGGLPTIHRRRPPCRRIGCETFASDAMWPSTRRSAGQAFRRPRHRQAGPRTTACGRSRCKRPGRNRCGPWPSPYACGPSRIRTRCNPRRNRDSCGIRCGPRRPHCRRRRLLVSSHTGPARWRHIHLRGRADRRDDTQPERRSRRAVLPLPKTVMTYSTNPDGRLDGTWTLVAFRDRCYDANGLGFGRAPRKGPWASIRAYAREART